MMHYENALPTKPDMGFPTYVPGTACFIYFLTQFVPFTVDNCFFAQSFINIAALSSFFCLISDKTSKKLQFFYFIGVSLSSVILCSMDISTYVLLVDTTVGIIPMGIFILLYNEKSENSYFYYFIVLFNLCFEALIKTSGLLFLFFLSIGYFIYYFHKSSIKEFLVHIIKTISLLLVPLILFRLYILRQRLYFSDINSSGQAVSKERYYTIFNSKSLDVINEIKSQFLKRISLFNAESVPQVKVLWICIFVLFILIIISKKKTKIILSLVNFIYFTFVIVIYYISMYYSYLYSFSYNDPKNITLECFYRYLGSSSIFVSGSVLFIIFEFIFQNNKNNLILIFSSAAYFIMGLLLFNVGYIFGYKYYNPKYVDFNEHFTTTDWDLCVEHVPEITEYNSRKYVVLFDTNTLDEMNSSKLFPLMTTYLRSNDIQIFDISEFTEKNMSEDHQIKIKEGYYLISLDDFSDKLDDILFYVDLEKYDPYGFSKVVH